jgi:hypothetical protein
VTDSIDVIQKEEPSEDPLYDQARQEAASAAASGHEADEEWISRRTMALHAEKAERKAEEERPIRSREFAIVRAEQERKEHLKRLADLEEKEAELAKLNGSIQTDDGRILTLAEIAERLSLDQETTKKLKARMDELVKSNVKAASLEQIKMMLIGLRFGVIAFLQLFIVLIPDHWRPWLQLPIAALTGIYGYYHVRKMEKRMRNIIETVERKK